MNALPPKSHVVAVVDDDESVRNALHGALSSIGLTARTFGSAEEFLNSGLAVQTACLISDIEMPGMNGLDLQARLARGDRRIPIIFITAYGGPEMREKALRGGAIEFLDKPFDDNFLLDAVRVIVGD